MATRSTINLCVAKSLAAAKGTKANTAEILKSLSKAGMLAITIDESNEHNLKRALTNAASDHARVPTPYGPLVQHLELGLDGCKYLEYVSPFAWLYHMSNISRGFATMMKSICVLGRPLRIVIYADGLEPGNPFRHDHARHLMAIYWCIADWPQHVLQRSFAWPTFAIIRTKFLEEMEGGLSQLMRMVLRVFFKSIDHSFTTGVHINCTSGDFVVTAIFAGFLADLVGHKEITEWKGTGGRMCCMTCGNVTNMLHSAPSGDEVPANCTNRKKIRVRSNDDVWNIVDDLNREFLRKGKKTGPLKKKETEVGFNCSLHGLLADVGLRDIYFPVDHCIRDWQHTVVQDGVANTQIFNILTWLKAKKMCNIEDVQQFSQICNYPSNWGKLPTSALDPARMKDTTIASFSSIILSVVIVMMMYLEKFFEDVQECSRHFTCFQTLFHIVGILRMGPESAMQHTETLRTLIASHLELCVALYGEYIKPKGHHLFHVVDGALWIGRLLSCFVTERKHRMVKQCAVNVFRHFEHTVLIDVVNQSIEQVLSGHDLYDAEFLISPKAVVLSSIGFRVANRCVIRVGMVAAGDLVITNTGDVGKIVKVFQRVSDDLVLLEVDAYPSINGDTACRSTSRQYHDFFESKSIVDTLIWYFDSPGIIRFSIPAALLYAQV